ncbi:hypothetical protein ACHAPF_010236 [Botrytis cinerea]
MTSLPPITVNCLHLISAFLALPFMYPVSPVTASRRVSNVKFENMEFLEPVFRKRGREWSNKHGNGKEGL